MIEQNGVRQIVQKVEHKNIFAKSLIKSPLSVGTYERT